MKKNFKARVVTANILAHEADYRKFKYVYYGEGKQSAADYTFAKRMQYLKAMFEYAKPDVVLMQEVSGPNFWGQELKLHKTELSGVYSSEGFPEFTFVNHGNRRSLLYEDNLTTEDAFACHNFVVFDKERYHYLDSETRFVTKGGTREECWRDPSSKNGLFNDLGDYTWVALEEKETKLVAVFVTTHIYTMGVQRQAYSVENLQCMTEYLEQVSKKFNGAPVVIAGDFNMAVGRLNNIYAYRHMVECANYVDSNVVGDDKGTSRMFGAIVKGLNGSTCNGERIDYIFSNGAEPTYYEVLEGMVKLEEDGTYVYVPEPVFDGSMYDISDHQPILTEILINEDNKLLPADRANYYQNPITKNDKVVEHECLSYVSVGDNMRVDVVEDSEKGKVLRLQATDELNNVRIVIDYKDLGKTVDVSGHQKIIVTYKTEYSLYGNKMYMHASLDDTELFDGSATYMCETAGRWKKLSLTVNQLQGVINQLGFIGLTTDTGFLRGDAIYVASIELE